jgi:hypothetical protein
MTGGGYVRHGDDGHRLTTAGHTSRPSRGVLFNITGCVCGCDRRLGLEYSPVQYNTIQCNSILYNTIQYYTIQ